MVLLLIGVCIIAALVRVVPRILVPAMVTDTYGHWILIKKIKEKGLMEAHNDVHYYPLGYHWLLSFLPDKLLPHWDRINGAFFDVIHVVLFSVTMWKIPDDSNMPDDIIWGWAPLLLALSPAWLSLGRGPRAYHGTARVFGELLVSGVFVCIWMYQDTRSWEWLAYAIIVSVFLVLSSKFGTQVLLSFCLIIGVLQNSVIIPFIPFVVGLLAYVVSKKAYGTILKGHISHLRWYARKVRKKRMFIANRNSFMEIWRIFRQTGILQAVYRFFSVNSLGAGTFQHLILIVVLILGAGSEISGTFPNYLWHWLFAGVCMWILSSMKCLLFIGAAERYLFAIAIPEYVLIAHYLFVGPVGARWVLLFGSFFIWLIYVWRMRIEYGGYYYLETKARRQTIHFLNTLTPMRLLTFDRSPAWDVAYKTHHHHFMIIPEFETIATWDDLFVYDTYPSWKAVSLLNLRLIVVSREALIDAARKKIPVEFPFSKLEKLFDNGSYYVYRVPGSLVHPIGSGTHLQP